MPLVSFTKAVTQIKLRRLKPAKTQIIPVMFQNIRTGLNHATKAFTPYWKVTA